MDRLPPIPTPRELRWREFRIKTVPGAVFVLVLAISAVIWVRKVAPPMVVGQVEGVQVMVNSPLPGTVSQLRVSRFQEVHVDDVVATVITTDTKVLEASLAVIKAEVDLVRASMDPARDNIRNEVDYERLRLEWLDQRVLLAAALVRQHYADAEFNRLSALFQRETNLVTQTDFDIAVRDRDASRTEVEERTRLTGDLEQSLKRLERAGVAEASSSAQEAVRAAIAVQERRLQLTEAQMSPVALRAKIDGRVTTVYRRSGESIVAGEPVITITSTTPERIVAYLTHPLSFDPEPGMKVDVRSRSLRRPHASAEVRQVASHMEPLPPTLLRPMINNLAVEVGLPIEVTVPSSLKLRVGELVDLRFLVSGK